MSSLLISFLFGLGAGGWVYSKVQRRNGGITQQSLMVAGGCGLAAMILLWVILSFIF